MRRRGIRQHRGEGIQCPDHLSRPVCTDNDAPHGQKTGEKLSFSSRFHHAFEAAFNQLVYKYKGGVKWFFRRKWLIGVGIAAAVALLVCTDAQHQDGTCCPTRDMGTVFVNVTTRREAACTRHQGDGGGGGLHLCLQLNRFSKLYRVYIQPTRISAWTRTR